MDAMKRSNTLLAGGLAATMFGMVGLSFAAVPLYRIFCEATGYAGTPQIRGAAGPGAMAGGMLVRFNANTSPGLPWQFKPGEGDVTVKLGEDRVLRRAQPVRPDRDRHGDLQRHAGEGGPLLPQDAVLLFRRANLGAGPAGRVPVELLG